MALSNINRRLSAGIELGGEGVAHARVWAPACHTVEVAIERPDGPESVVRLTPESDGFHSGAIEHVAAGNRYWYRLEDDRRRPDPVSRFQPEGPHGPSAIVDPSSFVWSDQKWAGVPPVGQVLYEMHVGTFTPEGTWAAAMTRLELLADVGVTVLQMMPVADFPGRWGWGYDGVNLYAPTRLYGTPDDLRRFVDRAHTLGLGVILDVVYNHLGPDGNYLSEFSRDYFTDRYRNDWGQSLNFEGVRPARDYFVENAGYWIDEFHFDGLRLDATQDIHDASAEHVIADIVRRARQAANGRQVYIVAENEPQLTKLVREPSDGGYGVDALLNDDYHHAARVALTGKREAYYTDYTGSPQELISASKYGYLYQGQWYVWHKQTRGTPSLDLPGSAFVHFLENHDQIANASLGKRMHQTSSPGLFRAVTALTLLGPATPLLFQGQEFAASNPFLFFADHREGLREAIRAGRLEFLRQFPSLGDPSLQGALAVPDDPETFHRSRLNWAERDTNASAVAMHRDLLRLRRDEPAIAAAAQQRVEGAVIAPRAFVLRYGGGGPNDRLLVVNLGVDLDLTPIPEPLLAPPIDTRWAAQWSSNAPEYGGPGQAALQLTPAWHVEAESALLLRPDRTSVHRAARTSDEPA
jgi:maltooligosyltrehalose trehalohydrolase